MQIILNNKTYIMPAVKAKMLRKAIEIAEKSDFNNIKVKDLDGLINFVVELFGKQFTLEDLYDNLDSTDLIPTLMESIKSVTGGMNATLSQFPKND